MRVREELARMVGSSLCPMLLLTNSMRALPQPYLIVVAAVELGAGGATSQVGLKPAASQAEGRCATHSAWWHSRRVCAVEGMLWPV